MSARRLVALGGGDPAGVPALALEELVAAGAADVRCAALEAFLAERGVVHDAAAPLIAADDLAAWRLVRDDASLEPALDREALAARATAQALGRLGEITVRRRRDCPWDREQTPATIVPHTIEEAYELADVALAGPPDAKLVDELGDVLFQSFILSVMTREAGAGDLSDVAEGIADKLVRRHPHVFGAASAETSAAVLRTWEGIKREQDGREGIFHDIPASLPTLLGALKTQKRASAVGFDWDAWAGAEEATRAELDELVAALADHPVDGPEAAPAVRDEAGDVLFAAVNLLRLVKVDPETALRGAAARFRARVEEAARIADEKGFAFADLPLDEQERYYRAAKERLARTPPEGAR
ncbi:MAG: nucleoside triphosphate pyrophosphohydrolase [Gaiellales bacterium]